VAPDPYTLTASTIRAAIASVCAEVELVTARP
jgi:hypothetical protein